VKYFFEDIEKQNELKLILDSWLGVKFRHHCGTKFGTDCIHFIIRVLQEMKILGNVDVPPYPPDWHLHKTQSLLVESILQHLNVENVGFNNLMSGDLVLYFFGRAASHASIYYEGHTYQAVNNIGVVKLLFIDKFWFKRKRYNFRILA